MKEMTANLENKYKIRLTNIMCTQLNAKDKTTPIKLTSECKQLQFQA